MIYFETKLYLKMGGKYILKTILLLTSVFLGLLPVFPAKVDAQGLQVIRVVQELEGGKGEVVNGSMELSNALASYDKFSDSYIGVDYFEVNYSLDVFTQDSDGNIVNIDKKDLSYNQDISKWISFDKETYSVYYQVPTVVNFEINIPENASDGGHYLKITFLNVSTGDIENTGAGLQAGVGATLLLTLPGDGLIFDGNLKSFESDKQTYQFPPLNFEYEFENTGNIHQTPTGKIIIHKNDINNPVDTIDINVGDFRTLPNNSRIYKETYNEGFVVNDPESWIQINWGDWNKFYYGDHVATLQLDHYENNELITVEKSIDINFFPWSLFIPIGVLVIVLGLILFTSFLGIRTIFSRKN